MSMETGSHLDSEGRRHLVPCRRDDGSISAGRGSKSMRKAIAVFLFASLMLVAASVSWGQSASTEATWESATWETLDAVPAVWESLRPYPDIRTVREEGGPRDARGVV